jgi:branched-subunit amino acid transport protein
VRSTQAIGSLKKLSVVAPLQRTATPVPLARPILPDRSALRAEERARRNAGSPAASAFLSVGMITDASRAGLIVFLADRQLPASITRALRCVGPAVLSALTVDLIAGGQGVDGVEFVEVAAIATAIVATAIARNLIAALTAGMATVWLVLWLV